MNTAASLSSLCCSFMDFLSLAGKDTPEHKTQKWQKCVLVNIPVCVSGISRSTWREDIGIEAHLKDDVAN